MRSVVRRLFLLLLFTVIAVAIINLTVGVREKQAENAYPATGTIIELDGVKIHAEQFGDGPDLVLIHGASGNTREFTFSLVDKLSDRYRVTVVDRPGLGWSTQPEGFGGVWSSEGESPRLQALVLKQATDQLGVTNPLVLGHSMGGAVAMAWALEHDDTAGLIMVSAVSHVWEGQLDLLYRVNSNPFGSALFVPILSAFVRNTYVKEVVAGIFDPDVAPDGYLNHIGPGLTLRRKSMRANAKQVTSVRAHLATMVNEYPSLTLPIEVLHGDADTIVPLETHATPLSQRVESATLTVLPGAGHMPQHTHEADVIAAIDRAAARAGLR